MGTSIPNRAKETGSVPSPVKILSPEEAELAWDRLNKPKGAIGMAKMQYGREDYLKLLSQGKTASQIAKAFGIQQAGLGYWLGKWELKDREKEEAALLEYKVRNGLMTPAEDPPSAPVDEEPVEEETAEEYESTGGIEVEKENAMPDSVDVLQKTEVNAAATPVPAQAFVSFALPLILINEEPGNKRERALERICDLTDRISTGDIDYPRLVKETLELLQVVISLVHAQTNDLTVKPEKVAGRVNEFFSHYNCQHIKRMEELATEFGWHTTQV